MSYQTMSHEQLLKELQTLQGSFDQYRDHFMSDDDPNSPGVIDENEQRQLDSINAMLDGLRQEIERRKGECSTDSNTQHEVTEEHWTSLKLDFVQAIQLWCSDMRHGVSSFERDMSSAGKSEDVSLVVKTIDTVVSEFIPANVKLARSVAEPIVKEVIKNLKSGSVTLRDFCDRWDSDFNDYASSRSEHDRMFADFRSQVESECGNDLTLERVSSKIEYLRDELPNREKVRKSLLKAWIESSQDEGWFIDEWDNVAGYFFVSVQRMSTDKWELKKVYLDDTDEQAGVIAMLKKEYPNAKLETLPFPMRLFITHGINNSSTRVDKDKSGNWSLHSGIQDVFDDWQNSSQGHPTVNDLVEESLL